MRSLNLALLARCAAVASERTLLGGVAGALVHHSCSSGALSLQLLPRSESEETR